jgi:hypothetical protein
MAEEEPNKQESSWTTIVSPVHSPRRNTILEIGPLGMIREEKVRKQKDANLTTPPEPSSTKLSPLPSPITSPSNSPRNKGSNVVSNPNTPLISPTNSPRRKEKEVNIGVDKFVEDLQVILSDYHDRMQFQSFATENLFEENVEFLIAAKNFRSNHYDLQHEARYSNKNIFRRRI